VTATFSISIGGKADADPAPAWDAEPGTPRTGLVGTTVTGEAAGAGNPWTLRISPPAIVLAARVKERGT